MAKIQRVVRTFAGSAVVVDRDRLGAMRGEIAGDQPAEIFRAAGDNDGFAFDAVIGHGRPPLPGCNRTGDRFC